MRSGSGTRHKKAAMSNNSTLKSVRVTVCRRGSEGEGWRGREEDVRIPVMSYYVGCCHSGSYWNWASPLVVLFSWFGGAPFLRNKRIILDYTYTSRFFLRLVKLQVPVWERCFTFNWTKSRRRNNIHEFMTHPFEHIYIPICHPGGLLIGSKYSKSQFSMFVILSAFSCCTLEIWNLVNKGFTYL